MVGSTLGENRTGTQKFEVLDKWLAKNSVPTCIGTSASEVKREDKKLRIATSYYT